MMVFFKIIVGFILLQQISCQCTFPTELIGAWVTSNDGTWIINTTSVQNYETKSSTTGNDIKVGVSVLDFECVENRGDTKYVLSSEVFELFNGAFVSLYTCLDIRIISSNKIIYYQATNMDPSGLQFTLLSAYEDVCNLDSYDLPYLYHVGLKSGLETSALTTCPSNMFGSYRYNDSCTDPAANETSVDVCDSRQQLIYNYTMCNTPQMFSQEGVLDCLHYETNGSTTYLTVYNRDTIAPDGTDYFRFICLAIGGGPDQVTLTVYPEKCVDNQDPNSITSPGQNYSFTSYYLCPIVTPTEDSFDWLPIILAIVGVLLLLIIIAIIIICCCCCKRRKKKDDEEEALDESESDEQSRKSSLREEDEASLDSGISEPPPSTRTEKDEHIIHGEGDGDNEDDKTSRPRTGENGLTERSRMSDLPPSTIPPEDEERSDEEDEQKEDNVEPIEETPEEDGEQKEEEGEDKDEEEEQKEEEKTDEEQTEEEKTDEEQEQENEPDKTDEEKSEEENPESETEDKEDNEEVGQNKVDGVDPEEEEKKRTKGEDMDVSTDEEERQKNGLKKGKHFTPSGALTSVLVSRDDDERNRQKQKSKSKKQRMNKLAKDKTDKDKTGTKGGRGGKGRKERKRGKGGRLGGYCQGSDEEFGSSDDEARLRGGRTAPFMKQYNQKKHIEQVLDDQHYWSDPEKDKDGLGIYDNMSSKYDSDSSGREEEVIGPDGQIMRVKKKKKRRHTDSEGNDSGSEIEIMGPDGKPIRVKKKLKDDGRRGRKKSGDGDDISNADSEYLRQKMLKRAGSLDSMMSIDDRKKLNEHKMKSDANDNAMNGESEDEKNRNEEGGDDGQMMHGDNENQPELDKEGNVIKTKGKTKTIHVKEKSNVPGADVEVKRRRKDGRKRMNANGEEVSDGEMDKVSDKDSGMDDDEEGDVDVTLTREQQALIVSMLFDEEMNVRPQFYRDENGRIVRRLDDTVIYDPHSGRFTFKKRLGRIFKVSRLKRNDKGRPTGGFIEDEFGPKKDASKLSRRSSSARRNRSAKSGRDLRTSSADMKRSRTDARNVGFDVPDDDTETIHDDEAEFYKRGNRVHSAMHRLKRRLFGKGKKHGGRGSGVLPDVRVKTAWSGDEHGYSNGGHAGRGGHGTGYGPGRGVGPANTRFGQRNSWTLRKGALVSGDPEQMQMYKEGLESDRKFLESLQGKLNSQDQLNKPNGAMDDGNNPELANQHSHGHVHGHGHGHGREDSHIHGYGDSHGHGYGDNHGHGHGQGRGDSLGDSHGHGHEDSNGHGHGHGPGYHGEYSFFGEDGRFIIRERGCPDLKNPKVPLFTIIRRPEDMESEEQLNGQDRNIKSAPLAIQDYNHEQQNSDRSENDPKYVSENSLARSDGRYSQYSYIDDNRLRRLLEELYKDKKYLDRYVETTEPKSEAVIHSKGLAEHGRGYLLERADFWERRGPLPPRPPMTEVGWKMQRQTSLAASRQTSELGLSTNATCTPDLSARHMPGVVESQNEENEEINNENKEQTVQKNESEA